MKLATIRNGSPDGRLVVVSDDLRLAVAATGVAESMREAIERWAEAEPELRAIAARLESGQAPSAFDFAQEHCAAPLPRSFQWCDGSAFLHHGRLMERAFNLEPIPESDFIPLMYQGAGDDFLGAREDVHLPDEAHGIDFEGEFGVIVDEVPMGISAQEALNKIRLVVQINDWSLRALGPREMRSGFGFVQAKPSTSFAPVAVTPDSLGEAWQNGRVCMHLNIEWNGEHFGRPFGGEMHFHFGELVAHAARTRRLTPGTIIGSGTVSNERGDLGSACIAERRVIEMLDSGAAKTSFMRFGDTVRMEARAAAASQTERGPFGVIHQRVVSAVPTDSRGA
ncbi:fumarylacetoacetate hydrolase family protein [Cupriavidus metallidurans]|uniref:fumarylacetoacetate hydrolase family protein n=1 Tax=Cupriavidus metallidurans TaxID=119219 RepID=UPI001CCCA70F|nr:fumarylacetoacetate hydrolase family protein [Cupriavidus metallidurans]UBM09372.1 fumarylacetoacetate hydrolase family protein [Cupriavidus metallidurans]